MIELDGYQFPETLNHLLNDDLMRQIVTIVERQEGCDSVFEIIVKYDLYNFIPSINAVNERVKQGDFETVWFIEQIRDHCQLCNKVKNLKAFL